jgi:hypothetical protein
VIDLTPMSLMEKVIFAKLSPEIQEKIKKNQELAKEKAEFNKEKFEFEERFYRLMFELGFINKANDTFDLRIESKTEYGFYAQLYRNSGLSFGKLKEQLEIIEENLKCIWIMNYDKFKDYAKIQIITKPLDENILYENPKLEPWEMYLGISLSLQINKINVNRNNMFLIGGATNSGKTRFIYMIILSWVLNCKINEIELYISDICKDEYCNLKYLKMCKCYCSELEQLYKMIKYLKIKFEKRKAIISKYREDGRATNIEEYNKINKIKMSYVYIFIDEASILMPSTGEKKEVKAMKEEILDSLGIFSKTVRSYGLFPIVATQKTTNSEINPLIRDMAAVRIMFRANGGKSSESMLGDDSAVGLLDRYALYSLDGGCTKNYLFSPKLTTEYLNELLKPHIDKNFKKVDIDLALKESNQSPQPEARVTPIPKKKPKLKIKTKENPYDIINIPIDDMEDDEYADD